MKKTNYDLRSISAYKYLCALGSILFGALFAFQVNAATIADSAFDRFMYQTVGAGQQTVSFGGNGQPLVTGASANLGLEGGQLYATRTATTYNPSGTPYSITGKAKIGAAAVGALAIKAIPLVSYLGAGIALYDFFKGLGYDVKKNPDGSVFVKKGDPTICTVSPCYEYSTTYVPAWYSTKEKACQAASALVLSAGTIYEEKGVPGSGVWNTSTSFCNVTVENTSTGATRVINASVAGRSAAPSASNLVESSLTELEQKIANESGWPSSVVEVVKQAQSVTDEQIKTEVPTVTGPATTPGAQKQEQKADGKTVTSTTTHNHTYEGNKINISNVTNNSVYNPVTNETTTETTTETPKAEPSDCEKNPESLACKKFEFDTPDGDIPKSEKNITYQAEDLGLGGGACPADKMLEITGIGSVKAFDWATSCGYITSYVRPMVLALAAFAAMMIIFVGVKTE